jgi:hypothetical protein
MQEISIYLYPNNLDAFTNLETWDGMRYRRVYNRNLKLYGGVDNKIKIQVRNVDQKPVNLTGSTMVFTLVSRDSQELLLEKDCLAYDITTGALTISISKTELLDIEPGLYNYSIRRETRTALNNNEYVVNASYPLYVDSQYDAVGTLEMLGNISGNATKSVVTKEWVKKLVYDQPTGVADYFVSGIVDAQPQFGTPQTLHSFQVYMTNYTGNFEVQGSLSEGGNPGTWVVLSTQNYTDKTMDLINVIGKWNFFRFKYAPTIGTVDKVLYR